MGFASSPFNNNSCCCAVAPVRGTCPIAMAAITRRYRVFASAGDVSGGVFSCGEVTSGVGRAQGRATLKVHAGTERWRN